MRLQFFSTYVKYFFKIIIIKWVIFLGEMKKKEVNTMAGDTCEFLRNN